MTVPKDLGTFTLIWVPSENIAADEARNTATYCETDSETESFFISFTPSTILLVIGLRFYCIIPYKEYFTATVNSMWRSMTEVNLVIVRRTAALRIIPGQ